MIVLINNPILKFIYSVRKLRSHSLQMEGPTQTRWLGSSLVAQWLRLCAPNTGGPGLIPGRGTRSHMHASTKSLHATTKEPACRNLDPAQPNK